MSARTNDELVKALGVTESAWASCAAIVDEVIDCMNRITSGEGDE